MGIVIRKVANIVIFRFKYMPNPKFSLIAVFQPKHPQCNYYYYLTVETTIDNKCDKKYRSWE